jgi:hypothetical protein
MLKKIISPLFLLSSLFVQAYVPQVTTSVRPSPRPVGLDTTSTIKEGVFQNGKLVLSIKFYDEGVFYQRNQREQLIPLSYYLKNDYPEIDFSSIRMTSLNINSKTMTDFSHIRFYSAQNEMIKESFIPRIDNPNEVFGDFINSTLTEYEINDFLYIGLSGYQNINNVTATFERGIPNFSTNLDQMPSQGGYVGQIEGLLKPDFSKEYFDKIMIEVNKMNGLAAPQPVFPDHSNNNDYYEDDYGYNDNQDNYDNQWDSYNPTPRIIPYRDNQDLIYNTQINHVISKVGLFGGNLILSIQNGNGSLTGYEIQRRNGRVKYTQMGAYIGPYRDLTVRLKKGDSEGTITFFFSSLTRNASPFIMRER